VKIFEALEENQSIVDFTIGSTNWMFKNKIGPNGVFPLRSLLYNNQVLTFLNISGCSITDEGLDHVIAGLLNNQGLKYLNITKNEITMNGFYAIFKAIKHCKIKELLIG
jgi:hypothetical protein